VDKRDQGMLDVEMVQVLNSDTEGEELDWWKFNAPYV